MISDHDVKDCSFATIGQSRIILALGAGSFYMTTLKVVHNTGRPISPIRTSRESCIDQ